jgi:hypothetical protein
MLGRVFLAFAVLLVAALTAAYAPAAPSEQKPKHAPSLEFRGQVIVPTGTTFMGTNVGGLSGIAYAGGETFYTLSDDQANARFYGIRAKIADGRLSAGDIEFTSVTILKQPDSTPYPAGSLDPEGFTLTKHNRNAIVTSEGFANRLIDPWIRLYDLDGTYVRDGARLGRLPPERRRHARRAPQSRLRVGRHPREAPLHRNRGRAGSRRPARDAHRPKPRAPTPL